MGVRESSRANVILALCGESPLLSQMLQSRGWGKGSRQGSPGSCRDLSLEASNKRHDWRYRERLQRQHNAAHASSPFFNPDLGPTPDGSGVAPLASLPVTARVLAGASTQHLPGRNLCSPSAFPNVRSVRAADLALDLGERLEERGEWVVRGQGSASQSRRPPAGRTPSEGRGERRARSPRGGAEDSEPRPRSGSCAQGPRGARPRPVRALRGVAAATGRRGRAAAGDGGVLWSRPLPSRELAPDVRTME